MNGQQFFRNAWLLALLFVSVGLITRKSHGETIVIGGGPGALPWGEQYSVVSVVDFDTNPGFIQPRQTDPNKNISLGLIARGGSVTSPNADKILGETNLFVEERLATMVSADTTEAFEVRDISSTGMIILIDLGERFGINKIKFFPRSGFEQFFLRGYEISLNDGSEEQTTLTGHPVFRFFKRTFRNINPVVDLSVPLQTIRFIRLQQTVRSEWEIDEFQVFGEGFVSSAAYTSKIFDSFDMFKQGQRFVFGGIEWPRGSIGQPAKSSATARARSGSGTSSSDVVWSDWSIPYPAGALTDILLPAPRRFFQFRILFESNEPQSAATVDSLAFQVSPAVADSIKGEIWPQTTLVAQDTTFAYTIRSFNSTGFDTLEIKTLAPVDLVSSVQIDGIEVDDIDKTDVKGGFKIRFPRRIIGDRILRVMFNSLALQFNTIFSGRVWDSQRPDWFPQSVVDGDVASDSQAGGDDLSVSLIIDRELDVIYSIKTEPNPFTPNGDGINDILCVTYNIVNLTDIVPVSVSVYDLSGRLRKEIYSGQDSSGRYQRDWDGTDDGGELLPPGTYLLRVELETDSGTLGKTESVSLVY